MKRTWWIVKNFFNKIIIVRGYREYLNTSAIGPYFSYTEAKTLYNKWRKK